MDRKRNVDSKEEIAEHLSTIIFNLADIEDFDPDIPLSELDLDPMELIEALRAEFDVDIAEQQIKDESQTLMTLVDFYEGELLKDGDGSADAFVPAANHTPTLADDEPTILSDGSDMFIELARARTATSIDSEDKTRIFTEEKTAFLDEAGIIIDENMMLENSFADLDLGGDDTQVLLPDEFMELDVDEEDNAATETPGEETQGNNADAVSGDSALDDDADNADPANGAYDETGTSDHLEVAVDSEQDAPKALDDSVGSLEHLDTPVDRLFDDIEIPGSTDIGASAAIDDFADASEMTSFHEGLDAPAEEVTQLFTPGWDENEAANEPAPTADFVPEDLVEDATQILVPSEPVTEDAPRELAEITVVSEREEDTGGITQIFVPDSAENDEPAIDSEPVAEDVTQLFTPDSDEAQELPEPTFYKDSNELDEGVTQIFVPDSAEDDVSVAEPTLIAEPDLEPVAEDVTQLFTPDSDEAQALPEPTLIKHADEVVDDVTQIFVPDSAENDVAIAEPTLITEPDAAPVAAQVAEPVAEDVTQLFTPDSDEAQAVPEPTLIKHADEVVDDVTQIFVPDSADNDVSVAEPTLITEPDAAPVAAPVAEPVAEEVTQLFTPDSDEAQALPEPTLIKHADEVVDDVTQIFAPGSTHEDDAPVTEDVTQIFKPNAAIDASRAEPTFFQETDSAESHDMVSNVAEPAEEGVTQIFKPNATIDASRAEPTFFKEADELESVDGASVDGASVTENAVTEDVTQIFLPGDSQEGAMASDDSVVIEQAIAEPVLEEHTQIFVPAEDNAEAEDAVDFDEPAEILEDDDSILIEAVEEVDDYADDELEAEEMVAVMNSARPDAPVYKVSQKASTHLGLFELVDDAADGHLSARQRKHLEKLTQRLKRKSIKSRRHAASFMPHQADPISAESYRSIWRALALPPVSARSKNGHIWDIDGNEYIDITLGGGVHFLGHAPDYINASINAALERGFELGIQSSIAGELAKALCEMTGVERVGYMQDGADAIRVAIRIARTVTKRSKIVTFSGSFHGDFDEALVRPSIQDGKLHSESAVPGVPQQSTNNVYVLQYGSPESLDFLREHGRQIAAIVVEPVQRFYPERHSQEFVQSLREIASESKSALVFDETISGFRTHMGGMQALWEIKADMVAWGSTLAAGMPLGVLGGDVRWLNTLDGGAWSSKDEARPQAARTFVAQTYARHPLSLAAANSALRYMKARGAGLQQLTTERVAMISAEVNAYLEEKQLPIRLHHFSSWFRFDIPYEIGYAELLTFHLRDKGVYLENIRQTCYLSTAHTDKDVKQIVRAIKESVDALQRSRFLPAPNDAPFPLSSMQESIWLATQMDERASNAFNKAFMLRMKGDIDQAVLVDALDMVVRRYEALHMRIATDGSTQQYEAPVANDIVRHDLRGMNEAAQQDSLWNIHESLAQQPFELESEKLYRFALVTIADNDVVLLTVAHALVFDGWSMQVFVDELRQLYNGLVNGSTIILPPTQSYSDYVAQEEEILTRQSGQSSREWWLEKLADVPEALQLPTDHSRPETRSYRGSTVNLALDAIVVERARQSASDHNVTFSELLLAAYAVLLNKLTDQRDLIVGIPFAQQPGAEMDGLVGSAETLLPVRLTIEKAATLRALIGIVQGQWQEAIPHAAITFGSLLSQLPMARDVAQSPLVQSVFGVSQPPMTTGFANMDVSFQRPARLATNFDLSWNLVDNGKQLDAQIDFNPDLFEASTVTGWIEQFEAILEQFALAPDAEFIAQDDVEDSAEIESEAAPRESVEEDRTMLHIPEETYDPVPKAWNETATVFKTNETFIDMFIRQVSQKPAMLAAVAENGSKLTYDELDIHSNRLANYLRSLELVNDTLIGISMGRSASILTAVMGVMKAGYAWVALDANDSAEKNEAIVNAAGLATIITEQGMMAPELANGLLIDPIYIDGQWPTILHQPASRSNRAMVSTTAIVNYRIEQGKAIGVQISQGALANIARSMITAPGLSPMDSLLNIAHLSQPEAVMELLLPLVTGARVIMASQATVDNPRRMAQILDKAKINLLQADCALIEEIIHSGWRGGKGVRVFARGEVSESLAALLHERGIDLWSLWGSAETGAFALAHNCKDGVANAYGKPVSNMQAHVLLEDLTRAGIGQPGRLYISGENLANGYVGDFELTLSTFIESPDYVSPLDIEVEPTESQILLGKLPTRVSPRGRVAMARGDGGVVEYPIMHDTGLYACWSEDGILHRAEKPAPMEMPEVAEVEEMDADVEMVEHSAEIAPIANEFAPQPTMIMMPASRTEAIMSDIWRELLDRKTIDPDADFFELGGYSLLGVKLVVQIEQKLGVRLPLNAVFHNPTVRSLSHAVDNTDWAQVAGVVR